MFDWIFGSKKMYTMAIYWEDDVNTNDLVDDLERIGTYLLRSNAQKNGCRLVNVSNWGIDGTPYKRAELEVDYDTEKFIRNSKEFKAVSFMATTGF